LAQALADQHQAHKALDIIGTNHLSMLVARLILKDSRLKTMVWDWTNRLRIIKDTSSHSAELRRGQAMPAFAYLGTRAQPVVRQLIELNTNQDTNIQLSAWYALEAVVPEEFHKRRHSPLVQHDFGDR
jgi:hypothetical protein